tara:strand:+ start:73 stop:555 length:483 start_codon:yes stop_codon:yes gene_type:complete
MPKLRLSVGGGTRVILGGGRILLLGLKGGLGLKLGLKLILGLMLGLGEKLKLGLRLGLTLGLALGLALGLKLLEGLGLFETLGDTLLLADTLKELLNADGDTLLLKAELTFTEGLFTPRGVLEGLVVIDFDTRDALLFLNTVVNADGAALGDFVAVIGAC